LKKKKKKSQKRAGGVAQGGGPKFKPQYRQNKKSHMKMPEDPEILPEKLTQKRKSLKDERCAL
jgi:hypothetical protein